MKLLNHKQSVFLFLFILFIKVYVFIFILNYTNMGGADANYYDAYATGIATHAVNIWPKILYQLNELGYYNREVIKYFLFSLSALVIPLLIVNILKKNKIIIDKRMYWNLALLVSLYPSLFLFSIDIYRDIVMVLLFLIVIYFFRIYTMSSRVKSFLIYLVLISLGVFLFFWRPYLGFSVIVSLLIYKILSFKLFNNFKLIVTLYILGLVGAYSIGILDPILTYRGEEGFEVGNVSMGIGLIGKNPVEFLILFVYSGLMQLFGLYIINFGALFLFITESLPFILACVYIYKNRVFLGDFEKFILLFCLIYATIWIIGNDNLGTAIRLRMYNYIGVLIVVGTIYLSKKAYSIRNSK